MSENALTSKQKATTVWFARWISALLLCAVMVGGLLVGQAYANSPKDKPTAEESVLIAGASTVEQQAPVCLGRRAVKNAGVEVTNAVRGRTPKYTVGVFPDYGGDVRSSCTQMLPSGNYILMLQATPAAGYEFEYWSEYFTDTDGIQKERLLPDIDPYNPQLEWLVTYENRIFIANFRKSGEYLIWNYNEYSTEGVLTYTPLKQVYQQGDVVTLNATAAAGYEVSGLLYAVKTNKDPFYDAASTSWQVLAYGATGTFMMPASDVWIAAVFTPVQQESYSVSLSSEGSGLLTFEDGTVTKNFRVGDTVKLVSNPNTGCELTELSGVPSSFDLKTMSFSMPSHNIRISAKFEKTPMEILTYYAPGLGSVTTELDKTTGMWTMTATPILQNSRFKGYYDRDTHELLCSDPVYTFPDGTGTRSINVIFELGHRVYIATNIQHGQLFVEPEEEYFYPGDEVTLSATPAAGYLLYNYYIGEVIDGQAATQQVLSGNTFVMGEKTMYVTAVFAPGSSVAVETLTPQRGTVTGGGEYLNGTQVTVTAQPNRGYHFVEWRDSAGFISADASYAFFVQTDCTLYAVFEPNPGHTITFEISEVLSNDETLTMTTDNLGRISSYPTPGVIRSGDEFVGWYYFEDGQLVKATSLTEFTQDTHLIARFKSSALQDGAVSVNALADLPSHGTVSADKASASFGDVITLTATPKPGFKFVGWTAYGDDNGFGFADKQALTTTYVVINSALIVAEFDCDFPNRSLEITMPTSVKAGEPFEFEAVFTSDRGWEGISDLFFALRYSVKDDEGYEIDCGTPVMTEKYYSGNAAHTKFQITPEVAPPYHLTICTEYGDTISRNFEVDLQPSHSCTLRRVARKEATSTATGNIAYWVCDECGKYYSDASGENEISPEDTVIQAKAPTITKQPVNKTVNIGDKVSLQTAASGYGTLSYQWQMRASETANWRDSTNSSAKKTTFTITAQAAHNGCQFRCVVTDSNGKTTATQAATLTVRPAGPTISTQPKNATVEVGKTAKFTVAATGTGTLTYQWQTKAPTSANWKNSTSASAKKATFSIATKEAHNGYQFRCVVTDGNGSSTTSNAATLTVEPAGPSITTQPESTRVVVGKAAKFTVAATGTGTLTYQWQTKAPNSTAWKNSTNSYAKKATFQITAQAAHDGYQFRCIITDGNGKTVTSAAATLTIQTVSGPSITTQPKSQTVTAGTTAKFTVKATGTGTLTYQWQTKAPNSTTWKDSTNSSATKATFSIATKAAHNGYQFRCIITDGNGNQTVSSAATLTVQ